MTIDPVCGMTVQPATAAGSYEYRGTTYYFCNPSCLTRFKADPESFLKPRGESPRRRASADALYTCPMHPEIVQHGPGACPKCGMALEPMTVSLDDGPNPELVDMTRRLVDCRSARRAGVSAGDGRHVRRCFAAGTRPCSSGDAPSSLRDDGRSTGSASSVRRRSCSGPAGRSSSAGGRRSRRVSRTCSRSSRSASAPRGSTVPSATIAPQLFPAALRMHGGAVETYFDTAVVDHRARDPRPGARACAPAAARAPRCDSCSIRRRRRRASSATARRPTSRSRTSASAIGCACGRERRFRPTASSSRAAARSTSRCSRESRVPVLKEPGARVTGATHQRHWQLRDARRARRQRDRARPDRPDGRRGAAHAGADSAAGRCGIGLVRAGGRRGVDRRRSSAGTSGGRSRGWRSRCSAPSRS